MERGAILKLGAVLIACGLIYIGGTSIHQPPAVQSQPVTPTFPVEPARQPFHFLTSAFPPGGELLPKYTCDGENVNPELRFGDFPNGTKSLALILNDPDAPGGTFTHWIVWNIAPETKTIPIGESGTAGVEGVTGFGKTGYRGPCPPTGKSHRYFFTLYALDAMLDLPVGASRAQLETAMEGHLLGSSEFFGTYSRK